MNPSAESAFSPEWSLLFHFITLPVTWIPPVQENTVRFLWNYSSPLGATVKLVLFLLPAILLNAGIWCTMLALYTLPFRARRPQFIGAVLTAWWDSGRAVALFWVGFLRVLFLSAGWTWGFIRILAAGLYLGFLELVMLPITLIRRAAQSSLQPGIPWIAVVLTLAWSLLEAGIFSYTLYPITSEIAADLVGGVAHPALQPALFFVLFLLIAGSFACLQVMVEAIQQKNWNDIAKMALVEFFVMFVEVVFLYRELVDAITPALAQQSGGQLRIGLVGVILISAVAWVGVRGMTWFLFGRFGTPTLLAIISGGGMAFDSASARPSEDTVLSWIKVLIGQLKKEINWFHTAGKEMLEAYILPPLQVIAAIINFFMVLFTGQHLFRLPLQNLHAFVETGELLKFSHTHEGPAPGSLTRK